MKIREIILELREYMNHDLYGAWVVATNNKIIPVTTPYGHTEIANAYLSDEIIPIQAAYSLAFNNHWVRVGFKGLEHDKMRGMYIDGASEDIAAVSHILLASCAQPDVYMVMVDNRDMSQPDTPAVGSKRFTLPGMRRQMMMYIKNETE